MQKKTFLEVRFQFWKHFRDDWAIIFFRLRDNPPVILLRAAPQSNTRPKPVRSAKKIADPWPKRYIRSFTWQAPQQTLGAIQMMRFESFKRFSNVPFWAKLRYFY